MSALRVLYDDEAFIRHTRSGITRYLDELIAAFRVDATLGVHPLTPYRWVASSYLADRSSLRHVRIPVPPSRRVAVIERLNRRRVRRSVATGTADIVHHSLYEPDALERWRAPLRVANVHDFIFERLPDVFPDAADRIREKRGFLDACDGILCVSHTTRADLDVFLPELAASGKFIAVTPHGVADKFFAPTQVSIPRLPQRYVLNVGNRHGHKNVDLLLRAFAVLAKSDPQLHLVLCGAAVPDELQALSDYGIADRTIRMRAPDEQLPWLYHRAQAFVFPSRYEGFGMPVLEAMAAGCPVIASDIAVMHEVGGDAVRYVGCDDVDALINELGRLLADQNERARLSAAGSLRARDFTWRRTAEATASAYAQLRG